MFRPVYQTPPELESCILELAGSPNREPLIRAVAELSAFFTTRRGERPANYLDTADRRSAYLIYFLTANYCKLHAVFDEMAPLLMARLNLLAEKPSSATVPFRLLDLGAGPGTTVLSALEYLTKLSPQSRFDFVAVDSNRAMLKLGEQLFQCFRERLEIDPTKAKLATRAGHLQDDRAFAGELFDVIVMANVWNEWVEAMGVSLEDQTHRTQQLLDRLRPDGALIWIEPALKATSRRLHRLHDAVLQKIPAAHIFAPCAGQQMCPCVAARNEKDWCHWEREWTPTATVAAIDRKIGNRKDAMKFSYLVLRKDGKNVLDLRRPSVRSQEVSACWRVVSELIVEKGKQRAFLCGEAGRIPFIRLDRHKSPLNQNFGSLSRGDVVKVEGEEARQSERRVLDSTRVEKI